MPESSPSKSVPPQTHVHAVARRLVQPLLATPITPNHLTTLRLVTGIGAALAFATGHYIRHHRILKEAGNKVSVCPSRA